MRTTKLTRLILLSATIALVAAVGMITTNSRGTLGRTSAAALRTPAPVASQEETDTNPPRLVRVFVHQFDLYPDLIRLKPGKIFLRAENEKRTAIALVVERVSAGHAPQLTARILAAPDHRRVRQELTLATGEYVFYEESNPALRGKIIVDPE